MYKMAFKEGVHDQNKLGLNEAMCPLTCQVWFILDFEKKIVDPAYPIVDPAYPIVDPAYPIVDPAYPIVDPAYQGCGLGLPRLWTRLTTFLNRNNWCSFNKLQLEL